MNYLIHILLKYLHKNRPINNQMQRYKLKSGKIVYLLLAVSGFLF